MDQEEEKTYNQEMRMSGRNQQGRGSFQGNNFGGRSNKSRSIGGGRFSIQGGRGESFSNKGNPKSNQRNPDDKHVIFKYGEQDGKEEFTDLEFILPGQDRKKKIEVQVYQDKSFEELIKTISGLWDVIDKYDLMKVKDKKHQRKRDVKLSYFILNLSVPTSTSTAKTNKADQDRECNMRLMFSFARDFLETSGARKAFKRIFMEEKKGHTDPKDIFLQKTLEICLEEVMKEILPKRSIIKQKEYMRRTRKPKSLSAKQWLHRLEYMNNNL
mmetsp:Transcript_8875/g.12647  ORF Transcript_8875/g.12647 Transcript_8875/m.12647 type:complete len:270 (+) Transcript_8875:69-878(+)